MTPKTAMTSATRAMARLRAGLVLVDTSMNCSFPLHGGSNAGPCFPGMSIAQNSLFLNPRGREGDSEVDRGADRHRAVGRQVEVVGGADRVAGEGDVEVFAPHRHPLPVGRADRHLGEEVDGVLLAGVALAAAGAG